MHEAQLHEKTSFITLTYNDKSLHQLAAAQSRAARDSPGLPLTLVRTPHPREKAHEITEQDKSRAVSLSKSDLQLFTKRLNIEVQRLNQSTKGIRYYASGEYGEKTERPHYHIALFGEDFSDDRKKWRTSGPYVIHRSSRLEELWPYGHSEIGVLTFESAAYIARYITKKITGEKSTAHYKRQDELGNTYWLEPEFSHMSRRPGLGKGWIDKYKTSVYPHDRVIINGQAAKPPRYYDMKHAETHPEEAEQVKALRKKKSVDQPVDRLRAGETITRAKLSLNKRKI